MSREPRIVGSFATPVEADAVRALLEAEGIHARLADEATVGMNWLLGNAVRGVKILVADDDLARAVQIVSEAADAAREVAHRINAPPDWKCSLCGEEVEGDFAVCWSCGATRDGAADPGFEKDVEPAEASPAAAAKSDSAERDDDAAEDETPVARSDESNPFRAPSAPLVGVPQEAAAEDDEYFSEEDEIAFRAWKASVLGFFYCPGLLHLYSTWLLVSLALNGRRLGRKAGRRCVFAWVINLAVVALVGAQLYWWLDDLFRFD
ncbi:MAG TPA: DUF2007 domain-containing protein [Pirellulales bacterium]|nr:DUF2007 domain-containing protein [Pirellulales bacterium]